MNIIILLTCVFAFLSTCYSQSVWNAKRSSWLSIDAKERNMIENYIDGYSTYLDKARTELTSTKELMTMLNKEGFTLFTNSSQIKTGAKLIFNNRDRALIAVTIGSEPIAKGIVTGKQIGRAHV